MKQILDERAALSPEEVQETPPAHLEDSDEGPQDGEIERESFEVNVFFFISLFF